MPWSEEERTAIISYFKKHLLLGKAPKKHECENFLNLHPQIKNSGKKLKILYITKLIRKKKMYNNK